jgi:hypothetical protein
MNTPRASNPETQVRARRRQDATLRQQSLTQAMLVVRVSCATTQRALAASDGSRAGGEWREAHARLQAAEVAGKDGELGRRSRFLPRQERGWVADAAKPVRVRRAAGQHRGGQETHPVRSEDRHRH